MKARYVIALLILLFVQHAALAQKLETIYINELVSTHFITSEPIQYVDISTDHVIGDMPVKNILRLKPNQQEKSATQEQGIVTIVCQKYMVQYRLIYADVQAATKSKFISSVDGMGLLLPEITISAEEMKVLSMQLLNKPKEKPINSSKQRGMKITVNWVYTSGDYFFMDVSIQNRSSITFEIDQVRFHVKDKKVLKATNVQQIELEPEYVLYTQNRIRKRYRNVFVFKKFTFPNEKSLEIEVSEKQFSGRIIHLQLDYRQILNAEPF
jgi:conjugative transposon TraN protein